MKVLSLLEISSALSTAGTIAIAAIALYQVRRSSRDSVQPLVYPEYVQVDGKTVYLKLRNYGQGPAIDVQLTLYVNDRAVYYTAYKNEQRVTFLNIATNESEELLLHADPCSSSLKMRVRYKSVLRERFYREIIVRDDEILGLDGRPSLLVRFGRSEQLNKTSEPRW